MIYNACSHCAALITESNGEKTINVEEAVGVASKSELTVIKPFVATESEISLILYCGVPVTMWQLPYFQ